LDDRKADMSTPHDHQAGGPHHRPTAVERIATAVEGWPGAVILAAIAGFVLVAIDLNWLNNTSIDSGWLLDALLGAACAGLVAGVVSRPLRWWATWGLGLAAVSVLVVWGGAWYIRASGLVGEGYPPSFYLWVWAAVWAVGVAGTGWWSGGMATRLTRLLTAPIVLITSFCLINAHYGYWPTVGAALGKPAPGQVANGVLSKELKGRLRDHLTEGQYAAVQISGKSVHFDAATAYVWLPPDFFHVRHAHLPVLLMLPGWPGSGQDWERAGGAVHIADAWARTHHGTAPVMVFVDENGKRGYDTECVNGPQGNAETYLTKVVPAWITHVLKIDRDPSNWATVGFSEGGTCAIGLAVEHPDEFGRFVDLAGDEAPNYGLHPTPSLTLRKLYGGNVKEERATTPLLVLAHHHYRGEKAWFAVANQDLLHVDVEQALTAASRDAGISARYFMIPGTHSWTFAAQSFARLYPALVASVTHHQNVTTTPIVRRGTELSTTTRSPAPPPHYPVPVGHDTGGPGPGGAHHASHHRMRSHTRI
jgi:S-formylglutathione hydrolase FrmB